MGQSKSDLKIVNMADEEDVAKTKEACSGLKDQLISCMKESECMLKVKRHHHRA